MSNKEPNPEERQRMIDDAIRELGHKEEPPETRLQRQFHEMHDRVERHMRRLLIASPNAHFDRNVLATQILPLYRDELKNQSKEILIELLASYYALRIANRL